MYIDPNSGGMLFQIAVVVLGVVSGVILVFSSRIKMGVARLRRAVREKFSPEDSADSE